MATCSKTKRKRVWRASKGRCHYCGRPLTFRELTLDHVIPKALGGNGHHRNLVAACRSCNEAKGDRAPDALGSGFWQGGSK